jgi:ParB family chromosome partitioning protein
MATRRTRGGEAARATRPRRKASAKRGSGRKRLTPRAEKQGLAAGDVPLEPSAAELAPLVAEVEETGGRAIGGYREPLSGRPLLVAALPIEAVEPTPFQRDLSPTHVKRLARKIEESGSYLDPIIVVRGADGKLWTPNGRHRLAAAKVLGLRVVSALVSADERLAFRILALNTEKAHNLRDRSLEVIRMARALAKAEPKARETDFAAEFDAPELLTLGAVYEQESRFAGGAYGPLLKKVDRFQARPLVTSLRERDGHAARLLAIDADVKKIMETLRARGFESPYLRAFVVARLNPVRFVKTKKGDAAPPMPLSAALVRMAAAAKKFDAGKVRERDLALVAAVAPSEE